MIVSEFNSAITDRLLEGAEAGLKELDLNYEVVKVPGAFEIPLIAARMADSGDYDALITLGVVIEGETEHYEMVCRATTDGIMRVMLDYKIPVIFEVLMVDDAEKAKARSSRNLSENKGYSAAKVAAEMIDVMKGL